MIPLPRPTLRKGPKLSRKQGDFWKRTLPRGRRLIISEGSVRSGKTWITNLAWIRYVKIAPLGTLLMSGRTKDSIRENVLDPIFGIIGEENYHYNEAKGLLWMFNRKIEVVGAEKADSEPRIRGRTYAGWYGDEITTQHRLFVKQAYLRCSVTGSQIFWTTNPDHPKHYIKTEYIDNQKLIAKGRLLHWHFNLDDNHAIDDEYKETIRDTFSGLLYKRMVLGLWCIGEGVVYGDDYNEKVHKLPHAQIMKMVEDGEFKEYGGGVDFGHTHPMAGLLYGVTKGSHPRYYQIAEFYKTKMKTEDLGDWFLGWEKTLGKSDPSWEGYEDKMKIRVIFCDSAEPDRIFTLRSQGLKARSVPDKDIMSEINTVGSLFKTVRLFISDQCTNTEAELGLYRFPDKDDPKEMAKAEKDQPLDKDNHAMDAKRYFTHNYEKYVMGQRDRDEKKAERDRVRADGRKIEGRRR